MYGAFLQPIQLALNRRRVTGEPVKGGFQNHELFMLDVYKAAKLLRQRCFLVASSKEDLLMKEGEAPRSYLIRMLDSIKQYDEGWEKSPHEPSRIVALFIKYVKSYCRSKHGISNIDFWVLEKERVEWLGAWKMLNKSTYLKLTCEFIEQVYDESLSPYFKEILRLNSIAVMTESGKGMSMDDVNEKIMWYLKQAPFTPYIDTACKRSAHTMLEKSCNNQIFIASKRNNRKGTSMENQIASIQQLLCDAGIFQSHEAVSMTNDYFWNFAEPSSKIGSAKGKAKEEVEYDDREQIIRDRLSNAAEEEGHQFEAGGDDDDDNLSTTSTVMGNAHNARHAASDDDADVVDMQDDDEWKKLSEEEKSAKSGIALKRMNLKRRKKHKYIAKDVFDEGNRLLLRNIKKLRRKAIYRKKRKFELIEMASEYFDKQMAYRMQILKNRYDRSKSGVFTFRPARQFEIKYQEIMAERRRKGLTSGKKLS
jgi:hypothetical protein